MQGKQPEGADLKALLQKAADGPLLDARKAFTLVQFDDEGQVVSPGFLLMPETWFQKLVSQGSADQDPR